MSRLAWFLAGLFLVGLAAVAWAQEPAATAVAAADPSVAVLEAVVRNLGLPGALVVLGWQVVRGLGSWQPSVRVYHHYEDRDRPKPNE